MDRSILLSFLGSNAASIAGGIGSNLAGDDLVVRLVLRIIADSRILAMLATGGDQAARLLAAVLEEWLENERGWDDDAAQSAARVVEAFLGGFLGRLAQLHIAPTDAEGLAQALSDHQIANLTAAPAAQRDAILSDRVVRAWFAQVLQQDFPMQAQDAMTRFTELRRLRRMGMDSLMQFSLGNHPMANWGQVVVDHGNFSQIATNQEIADRVEQGILNGHTFEAICVSLIGIIREATAEDLERRVSDYGRLALQRDVGAFVRSAPERMEGLVTNWVGPALGWIVVASAVIFAISLTGFSALVFDLFAGIMEDRHWRNWSVLFVGILLVYIPFTISIATASLPGAMARGIGRGVHSIASVLPFIDAPEPSQILEDIRLAGLLEHFQKSVRYTILHLFIYLGAGWFLFDTIFGTMRVADKSDLKLWFLYGLPIIVSMLVSHITGSMQKNKGILNMGMAGRGALSALYVATFPVIQYSRVAGTPMSTPANLPFAWLVDLPDMLERFNAPQIVLLMIAGVLLLAAAGGAVALAKGAFAGKNYIKPALAASAFLGLLLVVSVVYNWSLSDNPIEPFVSNNAEVYERIGAEAPGHGSPSGNQGGSSAESVSAGTVQLQDQSAGW